MNERVGTSQLNRAPLKGQRHLLKYCAFPLAVTAYNQLKSYTTVSTYPNTPACSHVIKEEKLNKNGLQGINHITQACS